MNTGTDNFSGIEKDNIALEYGTLREEILKRIEMRQQIIAITLTLAGVFLAAGIEYQSVVLIYPVLAACMAINWAQNDFRIRTTAKYIRERIEKNAPGLNYETYVHQQRGAKQRPASWRFVVLSHGGIFLATQLLAIGIELFRFPPDTLEWMLLVVDVIAVIIAAWVIRRSMGRWKRKTNKTK